MNEIQGLVELWRTTRLLDGLSPGRQEACVMCLESQRVRNENHEKWSQYTRMSIPLARRLFSLDDYLVPGSSAFEWSSRLEPDASQWKWLPLRKHIDESGNADQLDRDAELVVTAQQECGLKLVEKATAAGASKIYFGGLHLEQGMLYALYDLE